MAAPASGNAVSTSDTSAYADFKGTRGSLFVTNTGSTDEIYVRRWTADEVPAAITTTTVGVMAVRPSKTLTLYYDEKHESGGGYIGISYIMASGKTSTMDYGAI